MPAFQYVALDQRGRRQKGVAEADSARQLRQQLREKGLTPLEVEQVAEKATGSRRALFSRKYGMRVKELALFTRQLATLIAAGLPLEESLKATAEQSEKQQIKSLILGIRSSVLEGHSLSAAMREFPSAFSELYCGTVAAGEQTGRLDLVLNRLADYTEQRQQMREKVQQALIYPALMTMMSFGIVIFLLIYVVPKIIDVFHTANQTLPVMTVVLIDISQFVKHYGIYVVIVLSILIISFYRVYSRRPKFKYKVHQWLLKLPMFGNTIKVVNTARFARTFSVLLAAGMPVLEAMRMSAQLVTNVPMRDALLKAAKQVGEGTAIHRALQQMKFFPVMSVYLIASGETSGQLPDMLERAANNQENDVRRLIDLTLRLFEPALIIVMGGIVLFIVLAILVPIFSLEQMTG